MSLFPGQGSRWERDFQAANTESLAFLPPPGRRLPAINGKLIAARLPAHYENFT
jgi:hypothetical protein